MATKTRENDPPASRFWSKLNLMADITAIMSRNVPSKDTLLKVMQTIGEIIPFTAAALYIYNRKADEYKKELSIGPAIDTAKLLLSNPAEKLSIWVSSLKDHFLLNLDGRNSRLTGSGFGSLVAVPLKINDNPTGLFCAAHTNAEFFREQDIKLLTMLGQQLAISWEMSLYQRELELRNHQLEKSQKLLRLAQERLVNDERLQAVMELSATINHEINNPLAVIVGNIQCLQFIEKGLSDKVMERLGRIEAEAMKIAEINRRLLEIDDLVSETYINDGTQLKMLNIDKSASGINKNE